MLLIGGPLFGRDDRHGCLGLLDIAMAMHNAAMVRAVGQIELLFTLITSVWLLNERISRREVFGMALLVDGILMLI